MNRVRLSLLQLQLLVLYHYAGSQFSTIVATKISDSVSPWPTNEDVQTVDEEDDFGKNLSGVVYQPGGTMWAVKNAPSMAYKLQYNGSYWLKDQNCGWSKGKHLLYPDGSGAPDAEDVAKAEWDSDTFYVVTERDGDKPTRSRLSVLLYNDNQCDIDTESENGASITATMEWDLTDDLPIADDNFGLEALTWVPDLHLLERGFYDEEHDKIYAPDDYPDHGAGLFLVGLEDNGHIYAFALDHSSGSSTRIAKFHSGEDAIMALDFDRETCYLWAACDNTCDGRINVLELPTQREVQQDGVDRGEFRVIATFDRPDSMPNINNEGFTVGLENNCTESFEKFSVWSDDSNTDDHVLRQGLIPCGRFLSSNDSS